MIKLFGASFLMIAAKATQQLNVVNYKWWAVLPTSFCLALMEVYIVVSVVKTGMAAVLPMGLGGGLGCLCAMALFKRRHKQ